MEVIEPNWQSAIIFGMVWFAVCIGFFMVSGSLPVRAAPPAIQSGAGPYLVWLNVLCLIILATGVILFGHAELRLTSLIILGGLVFLFSPFVIQELPHALKDTKLGLILMLAILIVAIAVLAALNTWQPVLQAL